MNKISQEKKCCGQVWVEEGVAHECNILQISPRQMSTDFSRSLEMPQKGSCLEGVYWPGIFSDFQPNFYSQQVDEKCKNFIKVMKIHKNVIFWQLFLVEGQQANKGNQVFTVAVPDNNSQESFLLRCINCHQQKQVRISIKLDFGYRYLPDVYQHHLKMYERFSMNSDFYSYQLESKNTLNSSFCVSPCRKLKIAGNFTALQDFYENEIFSNLGLKVS